MGTTTALITLATGGLLSALALLATEMPSLPTPSGSYGIGRVSYELTDPSRPEPLSSSPNARRKMMAYVWYPIDRRTGRAEGPGPDLLHFAEVHARPRAG